MEQQEKQFETVLKKSVAMYSMLTGKAMTEREGRAFIEIFDMTEAYLANGASSGAAAETFDILSQVELRGPEPDPVVFVHKTTQVPLCPSRPLEFLGGLEGRKETSTDPASPDGDHTVTAEVAIGENGEKTVTKITQHEQLDTCGCPVGRCTCTDQMLRRLREDDAPAKRYTPPPIINNTRQHIQGYDWQIAVLARDKNPEDTYVIHYAYMPTQVEFAEHYIKFQRQTHYVHVNEWVNHDWEGITRSYDTSSASRQLPDKVVRTADAPELRGRDVSAPPVTSPWEESDKAWRIRFYSDVKGEVMFFYVDKRPTAAEMAHFHHAKCMAVSQARPKDAA